MARTESYPPPNKKGSTLPQKPMDQSYNSRQISFFLKEQSKRIDQESIYFLSKLFDTDPSNRIISEIPWEQCRQILSTPEYRYLVWMVLKGKEPGNHETASFIEAVQTHEPKKFIKNIEEVSTASKEVAKFFGDTYKFKLDSNSNHRALQSYKKVDGLLKNIAWHENQALHELILFVKYIVCLDNSYGTVEGFSDSSMTGLIAIGINNPLPLIAEEIVHESAHLFFHTLTRTVIDENIPLEFQPAFLSPFSDSLRPLSMIANGIFAYQMVSKYWEAIADSSSVATEFENDFGRDILVFAENRINEIRLRCVDGKRSILHANETLGLKYIEIINHWTGFTEDSYTLSKKAAKKSEVNLNTVLDRLECPLITKAEILLALLGKKISRVFLKKKDFISLANIYRGQRGLLCSSECFLNGSSEGLGEYRNSNLLKYPVSYVDTYPKAQVKSYIARNQDLAYQAFKLDKDHNAGTVFDYPQCCIKYFSNNYTASIKKYQGDLFRYMLVNSFDPGKALKVNFHSNASLEYFDLGLCWHFPCSIDCKLTIQRAKFFEGFLLKHNFVLLEKLLGSEIKILLDYELGWCKLEKRGNDEITTQWLSDLEPPAINYEEMYSTNTCGKNQMLLINQ